MRQWLAVYVAALAAATALSFVLPRFFPQWLTTSSEAAGGSVESTVLASGHACVGASEQANTADCLVTERQFVWRRSGATQFEGFDFSTVTAFGSWLDDRSQLVVGVDVSGHTIDLIFLLDSDRAQTNPAPRPPSVVALLVDRLRRAGAKELLTAPIAGLSATATQASPQAREAADDLPGGHSGDDLVVRQPAQVAVQPFGLRPDQTGRG